MVFFETSIFTAQITKLIDDESYLEFQKLLVSDPESGDLIRGAGGLRKVRWKLSQGGKSGGIRIIYYLVSGDEIYLLFAHRKNRQETLTEEQLRVLRALVDEHLNP